MTIAYKQSKALKQGWLVAYNVDADKLEIQRFDDPAIFDGDDSALAFVELKATCGDAVGSYPNASAILIV
jgi:hypothetical protein